MTSKKRSPQAIGSRRYAKTVRALADRLGRNYGTARKVLRGLKESGAKVKDARAVKRLLEREMKRGLREIEREREETFTRKLFSPDDQPAGEFGWYVRDSFGELIDRRFAAARGAMGELLTLHVKGWVTFAGVIVARFDRSGYVTSDDLWTVYYGLLHDAFAAATKRNGGNSELAVMVRVIVVTQGDAPPSWRAIPGGPRSDEEGDEDEGDEE